MMPDIEQDQVADTPTFEAELIGVLDPFDPRIRKNIRGDAVRKHGLDIAEPRAELDDASAPVSPDPGGNLAIEPAIHRSQSRLFVPSRAILVNLDVVLLERRTHEVLRLGKERERRLDSGTGAERPSQRPGIGGDPAATGSVVPVLERNASTAIPNNATKNASIGRR